MTASTAALAGRRPLRRLLPAARAQVLVAGGQAAAGLGNLLFVAVAARMLAPAAFGQLVAAVAIHTAMHVPGAGLAAVAALDPRRGVHLARRCAAAGLAVGAAMALAAGPLAAATGLTSSMVLALAVAAPVAPLLGLRRGAAYGQRAHGAVVLSLLSEPFARGTLGLSLATVFGASGAVWGVTAGGWMALLALAGTASTRRVPAEAAPGAGWPAAVAFVLATLLQHQDVIVANRLLDGIDAGAFAALSTVGGLVAFATATLPLVALPDAADGDRRGSAVAVALAVAIGAAVAVVAAWSPGALLRPVAGDAYGSVTHLVLPYVLAMAALGVARVLAAQRCATGGARRVAITLGVVAAGHLLALVAVGRSVGAVVATTAVALTTSAVALAVPVPLRRPAPAAAHREAARGWRARAAGFDLPLLGGLVAVATALRLATNRSIWIDEATSVSQARMGFGDMLSQLAGTDVHPPLHHVVLWVTARIAGTGEVAMRAPSVLAGVLTVPAVYGLARELFDRRTARLAAALVVPAPFLVWYAQEARMYSLFMLAGVCSLWAQVAAHRRGRASAHVAWALGMAAMVWSQWFGLLPVAAQLAGAAIVVVRRRGTGLRQPLLGLLATTALLALALAPLVPLLQDQLAAYGDRGAGLATTPSVAGTDAAGVERDAVTVYAVVANLVWAGVGYHADDVMAQLGALWPIGMLVALLALGRRMQAETKAVVAVALVPAAALLVVGTLKRDLFEVRYFALLAPLLLVLLARATTTVARSRLALGVATVVLVGASVVGLVDQQVNGANPRLYDFRSAVADIRAAGGDHAEVALEPRYLDVVTGYYGPDLEVRTARGLDADTVGPEGIDVLVAERFIGDREGGGAIGEVLYELEERFGPPERIEHPNVIVWRFR